MRQRDRCFPSTHEFGVDDDGDPETVNIVSEDTVSTQTAKPGEPKLPGNERTMFAILHDAGRNGLPLEEWNADAGIGTKRRAYLVEARLGLKKKGLVMELGDRWMVNHS